MFYCDPCRKENKWPGIMTGSVGPCEVCGKVRPCYDVPTSVLPKKDKNNA